MNDRVHRAIEKCLRLKENPHLLAVHQMLVISAETYGHGPVPYSEEILVPEVAELLIQVGWMLPPPRGWGFARRNTARED